MSSRRTWGGTGQSSCPVRAWTWPLRVTRSAHGHRGGGDTLLLGYGGIEPLHELAKQGGDVFGPASESLILSACELSHDRNHSVPSRGARASRSKYGIAMHSTICLAVGGASNSVGLDLATEFRGSPFGHVVR